jgi:hypothetical protein
MIVSTREATPIPMRMTLLDPTEIGSSQKMTKITLKNLFYL